MEKGWIKLHRKLQDSDMYKSLNSKQRDVFLQCLLLANYTEKEWEWKGKINKCLPGQLKTSIDSLKKYCAKELTKQNIRTALLKLERWGFLTNESTKQGRIITICKWEDYQILEKELTNELTDSQPTTNRRLTDDLTSTKKKRKIRKEIKEESKEVEKQIFNEARELYPGTKRGNETEFNNFIKQHKDWKECIDKLLPAIKNQLLWRAKKQMNEFVPVWKNFKTWINQKCWEEEHTEEKQTLEIK